MHQKCLKDQAGASRSGTPRLPTPPGVGRCRRAAAPFEPLDVSLRTVCTPSPGFCHPRENLSRMHHLANLRAPTSSLLPYLAPVIAPFVLFMPASISTRFSAVWFGAVGRVAFNRVLGLRRPLPRLVVNVTNDERRVSCRLAFLLCLISAASLFGPRFVSLCFCGEGSSPC